MWFNYKQQEFQNNRGTAIVNKLNGKAIYEFCASDYQTISPLRLRNFIIIIIYFRLRFEHEIFKAIVYFIFWYILQLFLFNPKFNFFFSIFL